MIYILLIVSLAMLVIGANWLVDGSAAIARRYHISEYIIGATIVGMGTSTPELVISSLSAFEGHSDIAVGNVVGSNIFNVFLILGITALIMPIKYTRENLQRDIPINIGVSVVTIALCALGIFWHGEYGLVRFDGLLMLVLFALYLWTTIRGNHKHQIEIASEEAATSDIAKSRSTTVYIAAIVFGLAGLIFGGDMFIDSASDIAREWGVSEAIIGLTIVAGGTSLPELVSSLIAVSKKKGQMALGNIVGSNIFNILFILGVSSLIHPLTMGDITFIDWSVMLFSAIALLLAAYTFKKRQLDRKDAILFLLIYAAYMTWLIIG